MQIMKTIAYFKKQENYGKKSNYAKIVYDEKKDYYELIYKYATMEKEQHYKYDIEDLAMYYFHRVIMFILS